MIGVVEVDVLSDTDCRGTSCKSKTKRNSNSTCNLNVSTVSRFELESVLRY